MQQLLKQWVKRGTNSSGTEWNAEGNQVTNTETEILVWIRVFNFGPAAPEVSRNKNEPSQIVEDQVVILEIHVLSINAFYSSTFPTFSSLIACLKVQ